jgi:hypothetical protein
MDLGVALQRAFVNNSELPACSLRAFLLAAVWADLLPFEPNRGHGRPTGPEMLAREVPLLPAQAGDRDGTVPLQKPDHGGHWGFGGKGDTQVHVVWPQVPLDDLALLLLCQSVENRTHLATHLPENQLAAPLGYEYDVILAVPL